MSENPGFNTILAAMEEDPVQAAEAATAVECAALLETPASHHEARDSCCDLVSHRKDAAKAKVLSKSMKESVRVC